MAQQYGELRRERIEGIVACLGDNGFPGARINPDGTTTHHLTPEQDARFDEVAATCTERACPHCAEPPSRDQLTRLYHLELAARACLGEHGISIEQPPSLETYLAAPPELRWSAHREGRTQLVGPGSDVTLAACPDPGTFITYFN